MKAVIWVFAIAVAGGFAYWFWHWGRRRADFKRASEERSAAFMAEALLAAKSKAPPEQRLLFEAAGKAAEAGEPVLAIQLYARLLARYPDSAFAAQARAAVALQKKSLSKA
jgi:hypothetical protein